MVSPRSRKRALVAAGFVAPIQFILGFTTAGWLRPGYSAMAEAVSDLGVGPEAWIQNVNFLLFGALLMLFAAGFWRTMRDVVGRRSASVGGSLIALTGVGSISSAAFPAAPPTDALHFLAGFLLAFGSAIATTVVVGRRLRDVSGWQGTGRYSLLTAAGAVALVIVSFVALNPASPLEQAGLGGLIERLLTIEVFTWHAVMARRIDRALTR